MWHSSTVLRVIRIQERMQRRSEHPTRRSRAQSLLRAQALPRFPGREHVERFKDVTRVLGTPKFGGEHVLEVFAQDATGATQPPRDLGRIVNAQHRGAS